MIHIKATIVFEKKYWVGIFERTDQEGYAAAKHIFGAEPSDPEVYAFVLEHYQDLRFGKEKPFTLDIKRMNPKRLQREVRREMARVKESSTPSTFAQDYMREELESGKKEKKQRAREQRKAKEEELFALKQEKRKRKHRGH